MQLTHATDDGLPTLSIHANLEGGVLLGEPVQGLGEGSGRLPVLWGNSQAHHRLWHCNAGHGIPACTASTVSKQILICHQGVGNTRQAATGSGLFDATARVITTTDLAL